MIYLAGPDWHCESEAIEGGWDSAVVATVPERWISLVRPGAQPFLGTRYGSHTGLFAAKHAKLLVAAFL